MIKISQKTLTDLEFPKVREQLSEFCSTEMGKAKALKLKPFKFPQQTIIALNQTQDYKSSFLQAQLIPSHSFEEINEEIHLLEIANSMLEIKGLRNIARISETANAHLRFFKKNQELYPNLFEISSEIEYTDFLTENIHQVIDRFGEIRNDASALLEKIRQALDSLQAKIDSSFNADMEKHSAAGYLDEIKESFIDNKRVLAVSAMYRRRVNGVVLGRSKTGSIVFIQPQNTLKFSQEWNNLKYDEKEEINRILKALTEKIRPYRELLSEYQEFLSEMDLIAAKVKYGDSINAVLPKISKKRELELIEAYHPLLYINNKQRNKKTYPQDIKLDADNRIIVISGPNAGGKSITLKTVGLLQIMMQSGLFVPVHEYSRMCFFTKVLSDIGDHQSIENHLSTYSYRLKNMRKFLRKCDKNTLFLIDEFGTGTDPELGGALAETFLEVFYERKSFGIITTHYANLKKMANETDGISNANMRFDSNSLEPEFKLQLGEAGSSFTFEVAQKNGIPYSLINRSKKKVERGKIRFDKSIAKLQQERSKLVKTTAQLEKEKKQAEAHQEKLDDKNTRIQQKLEDFQELYDYNQQLIHLGRKIEKLSDDYLNNKNKKQLISEFLKVVAIENSKKEKQTKREKNRIAEQQRKVQQEAEKKLEEIRIRKEKERKKAIKKAKEEKRKRIESYGLQDKVRIEGSKAIGTIDRIEKGKAVINYGMFTTEVSLEQLELVQRAK